MQHIFKLWSITAKWTLMKSLFNLRCGSSTLLRYLYALPWSSLRETLLHWIFFLSICFNLFIYGCVGLRFCARASSSCGKRGPPPIVARGPLTIAAPPAAEHRLQTRRLSNRGSRAQSLRGTWDPPRPGLEPAPPALAGRLSTTAPPGKPYTEF